MKSHDTSRNKLKTDFLQNHFSGKEFEIYSLPADASFRTYDRIAFEGKNLILMDSPPVHYSLKPFIKIAAVLRENKFSAPEIYAEDHVNGFLLLEDFGHINIGAHLAENQDAGTAEQIYKKIIELSVAIQNIISPTDLTVYDEKILLKELEIYTEWYVPHKLGKPLTESQKKEFFDLWIDIFKKLPKLKPCLVLRDYHVENMMLLERNGLNSIGLLDFQDAVIGHPLYDVVSVLEDARIEVPKETGQKLLNYYLSLRPDIDKQDGSLSYHILAAQRNLRILGVFARKAIRDGQENYLKYIPRLHSYLEHDLSHEVLQPVKNWIKYNV